MDVLQAVKAWGLLHKRLMTEDEFNVLAKEVLDAAKAAVNQ